MVKRELESEIRKYLFKKKTIAIYGARQVGKTTLVEMLLRNMGRKVLYLNGDDTDTRELLARPDPGRLNPVIASNEIVVIDEAQRLTEAGLTIKIIHDNFKSVQLIVTGSSSLELSGKISEPMTGRLIEFFLHPLSFREMSDYQGLLTEKRLLEHRLVYGYYPDIALNPGMEVKFLKSLTSGFLYKDLLSLEKVQKPALPEKLLKALALQCGNEVSFNELSSLTGYDRGTIERYTDLLEKAYIIFRLTSYSRNVRNELRKSKKIYFYDNGIRNAITGSYLPLHSRSDVGALWENYLISERHKLLNNRDIIFNSYFWRTSQQQEIDYIEEREGKLHAFEFKWNIKAKSRLSRTFEQAYPGSVFRIITPENYIEFLTNV